jgi:hypothetical protein
VIPGLIAITEERQDDGSAKIIFEVEEGKQTEFFAAFELMDGDVEGLQRVMIESIQAMIDRQHARDAQEER